MAEAGERKKRRWRSVAEKLRIVEESLVPGASVALVARAHEVNANQVFSWRRLYRQGLLQAAQQKPGLIPVRVAEGGVAVTGATRGEKREGETAASTAGSIQIELASARLRIEGAVDRSTLLTVLECLQG